MYIFHFALDPTYMSAFHGILDFAVLAAPEDMCEK
jgi:hypothetical protein